MYRPRLILLLLICWFTAGCTASQNREATTLQNVEASRPQTYRRFAHPRPSIGFLYPVGVGGGIEGIGVGGACP